MAAKTYYVETSVWGMIPKGQPRDMRNASLRFLRQPRKLLVSTVVLDEIDACPEDKREQIMKVLNGLQLRVVEPDEKYTCRRRSFRLGS